MSDVSNQQLLDAILGLGVRMDRLESRMDSLETRMANIELRLDKVEARLDVHDGLFAGITGAIQTITDNMVTKDDFRNLKLRLVTS